MHFVPAISISLLAFPALVFTVKLPLNITPSPVGIPLPLNLSVLSVNTSANDVPPIYCQGLKSGAKLNLASCINALSYLPSPAGPETISFGNRGSGTWDINVPDRYLSSDGLCAVDISLHPSAPSAHTSGVQLYTAAYVLVNTCAARSPPQGGIAVDIGGDNNLVVSLNSYEPVVECVGSKSRYQQLGDCNTLLNKMDVSIGAITFGDATNPRATVRTPYTITEPQCTARIKNSNSAIATTSWAEIYLALTAINAMCLRGMQNGFAMVIGTHGMLEVELAAKNLHTLSE